MWEFCFVYSPALLLGGSRIPLADTDSYIHPLTIPKCLTAKSNTTRCSNEIAIGLGMGAVLEDTFRSPRRGEFPQK